LGPVCLWSAYSVGTPARNARMDGVKVWDWDADTHTPACQMRHGFTMCVSQGGVWQQRDIYTYIYTLCIDIPLGRISQGGVWQQRDIYTYIYTLCIDIPLGCVSQGGVWQQRGIYTYIYTLCIDIPLGRISQGTGNARGRGPQHAASCPGYPTGLAAIIGCAPIGSRSESGGHVQYHMALPTL
jgi:hypothetical protein